MKILTRSPFSGYVREIEQTLDREKTFAWLKLKHRTFSKYADYSPVKGGKQMLFLKDDEINFVTLNLLVADGELDEELYENLRIDA